MRKLYTVLLLLVTLSATAQRNRKNTVSHAQPVYEKGALTSGQPTGIWEYYDQQGELTLRMNYDSSRIAYSRPDTARYLLRVRDDWQEVRPTRTPQYMGSRDKRKEDMSRSIRYPVSALQQQTQGQVIISYVVNEQGKTADYQVVSAPSNDCAEAVWAALKKQPDKWIPAVYQGRVTPAQFLLRVTFRIMDEAEFKTEARRKSDTADLRPAPYVDELKITAVFTAIGF